MITVSYRYRFEYPHDVDGKRFPRLDFRASRSRGSEAAIDVQAYLDGGSERSLFSGWIGTSLGIDILSGPRVAYESAAGSRLSATIHGLHLVHDELGAFDLEAGFTTVELKRNLLGRDFFNLTQIGFREHHQSFFVTPDRRPLGRHGCIGVGVDGAGSVIASVGGRPWR